MITSNIRKSTPNRFATNEIPTVLEQNWNRLDNQHIFFTHRYNVGFSRKVKMTEEEIKAKKFAMASKKENAEEDAKEEARKKAKEQGKKFDESLRKQQKAKFSGRPDGAKIAGDEPAKDSAAKDIRNDSTRIAVNGKLLPTVCWPSRRKMPKTRFLQERICSGNEFHPYGKV